MSHSIIQNFKDFKTQNPQAQGQQVNFCPKCGILLKITIRKAPSFKCPKCQFKKLLRQNETPKMNLRHFRSPEIVVIGKYEESLLRPIPTVKDFCPTCGKGKSETWSIAVGAESGPSMFTFFRCTKCGSTRRETG